MYLNYHHLVLEVQGMVEVHETVTCSCRILYTGPQGCLKMWNTLKTKYVQLVGNKILAWKIISNHMMFND